MYAIHALYSKRAATGKTSMSLDIPLRVPLVNSKTRYLFNLFIPL
jgi:hypothetical protein